jgi:hypothetical protein
MPTMVATTTAVITNTAWTSRNPVGEEWPTGPDQARESSQMATENLGQMAQLKTPTATRNKDQPRVRITLSVSPAASGIDRDLGPGRFASGRPQGTMPT